MNHHRMIDCQIYKYLSFKRQIHFKGRVSERKRQSKTRRERETASSGLLHTRPQGLELNQAEARRLELLLGLTCMGRSPSALVIFCCFPRSVSSELHGQQNSQDSSQCSYGIPSLQAVTQPHVLQCWVSNRQLNNRGKVTLYPGECF